MTPVEPLLADVRSHYESDRDLHRVVLNATSWVEANLAVDCLAETLPEKSLVAIANVREAIKELPRCPMPMPLDFEGLAQIWQLEREGSAWARSFEDEAGGHTILLIGEGNYCYDLVVRTEARTIMWMPRDSENDYLNPDIIDLMIERPSVLRNVIDMLQAMGILFYPTFYLSLDDWRQEYATTMFEECIGLFSRDGAPDPSKHKAQEGPQATNVRYRGMGNDGGVAWLF